MVIEEILINLGLTANEAKIYLASLEMGVASSQIIAKKAKIKRTTAYSILNKLVKKDFVIKTKIKGKFKFIAQDPRSLSQKFFAYQKSFENLLPQLDAIHNKKKIKPSVWFFEDKDGIKNIYQDTINEKPEIILEFNTSEFHKSYPDFPNEYLKQRKNNNIRAMRIAPKDKIWKYHKINDKEELSETKLINLDKFQIPIEINIYNDKVAFMSYHDELGLIIKSEDIAKSMRQIYYLLWDKLN